jgi:hypothetical protein
MDTRQIDLVNIGLMIVACIAAYLVPFEMFLFSYAVLGPLHYLTEISWLHKRDYFATGKMDYIIFLPISIVLTYFVLFDKGPDANVWATNLVFVCFVAAMGMVLFRNMMYKLTLALVAIFIGYFMSTHFAFQMAFGMYLPTLIHVFIFTGLFIIYGALKNKSVTGLASVLVFVICGASFFVYRPILAWYHISEYAIDNIKNIKFDGLVYSLIHLFHMDTQTYRDFYGQVFGSIPGHSVMRFIAFAYTYHYLNWFSKTSVIKWHKVPRKWLIVVLTAWISAVVLYMIDYMLGLEMLFLLSMLHVFMEFPLNYRSVIGIAEELGLKIPQPAVTVAAAPSPKPVKKGK